MATPSNTLPVVSWRPGTKPGKERLKNGVMTGCRTAASLEDFAGFETMTIWCATLSFVLTFLSPKPLRKQKTRRII